MQKRRKWIVIGSIALAGVLGFVSTLPTSRSYLDGTPQLREIRLRVLDSGSRPVQGVAAAHIYSRGYYVVRTEQKAGVTDADGRLAIPMRLGGNSGSEFEYVWGLAKHSEHGFKPSGWQFLWGLIDLRGPELRSTLSLRGEDGSTAQIPESDFARLPVDTRIRLEDSTAKGRPNDAVFCRDGMVDVSSYVVMLVRRKDSNDR